MKAILLTLFALAAALPQAIAQEADLTRATVDVGEGRLESLLTDAQKQAVKHLTVTGTLAEEDYAYLRSGLLAQLDTLDLRQADIDTIPKHAFYCRAQQYHEITITLPERLKHLSDSSMWEGEDFYIDYVLTGKYPTVGIDAYSFYGNYFCDISITPSEDNAYCTIRDYEYIVSMDSTIVYKTINKYGPYEIPTGTRIIADRAFENSEVWDYVFIPSTVDSIGDGAFANLNHAIPLDGKKHYLFIACLAQTPPRLGKGVFLMFPWSFDGVYVPRESLDLYLAADGWKDVVRGDLIEMSVESPKVNAQATVRRDGSMCRIMSGKAMSAVSCYAADGKLLGKQSCNATEAALPLNTLGALIILKVDYADGTSETIKLKP